MQLVHLEAAVIFGLVIPQIYGANMPSPPSDCAAVEICMSDLCKTEQAFSSGICEDDGCRIKGSEVCNLTIQTVLDQFPSLKGCMCTWEEELCDSIQALATQCHPKPAGQQKRSAASDWRSSRLIGFESDGAGSCLDRMRLCVSDAVCNRYLAPVLQACAAQQCDPDHCQHVTQHFYRNMPHSVAEMLVMCECEASDQSCLHMKTALHSGTCGDSEWICQDTLKQCVEDSYCRHLLTAFRAKCWSFEEDFCDESDEECLTRMDPALLLGADSECKRAFLATLGSALHRPCSCRGVHSRDLQTCNMIHDVLQNRSHFKVSWGSSSGPSKPPEKNKSEQSLPRFHRGYLLHIFAALLVVAVVVLMPLVVVSKIWLLRRRDKTRFHPPQKRVVIL